jgi:integrase
MSPRRGKRVRVALGLYKDGTGYAATVKVAGKQLEKRYPPDTALHVMQTWQRTARARKELDLDLPAPETTLKADADQYLALLPDTGRATAEIKGLLVHWTRLYGHEPRKALTTQRIAAQMLQWVKDGVAPQTVNHRRRVLVSLWRVLDGPDAENPAKAAPKLRVPYAAPRGLPWPVVERILAQLGDSVTAARIRVLAHTGWPHSVLGRVEAKDLHLTGTHPYALLTPRRKGAGVPARAIPLTPAAVSALRALVKLDGLGTFSTSSLYRTFRTAAKKAKAPPSARPYDLRHSFLSAVYEATHDLRATQELALHASIATTSRYAESAVSATARAAIAALVPAVPAGRGRKMGGNVEKRGTGRKGATTPRTRRSP